MVELVDTRDLKSLDQEWLCGFESRSRHKTCQSKNEAQAGFKTARGTILFMNINP